MRRWLPGLLILLIAGCAAPPIIAPQENPQRAWQIRQAQLLPLATWRLSGRVAVHTANDGGQASLHWEHSPGCQTIDLRGPLGHGLVRLHQDAGGARLEDSDRNVRIAENAEALLFDATGWHIPLDGLNFWIRGVPIPDVPMRHELDDQGRLKALWQSGWEIRFLAYTRFGGLDLPSRMTLLLRGEETAPPPTHDMAGGFPVEARLIVERWTLLQ